MNFDNTIVSLKNVYKNFYYDNQIIEILKGVNLDIHFGEFVAIMGPSGSGKSTLLNIIGLIDSPSSGEVNYFSKTTSSIEENEKARIRSKNIGFVFQNFNLFNHLTVFENVMIPLLLNKSVREKDRKEIVMNCLNEVGMMHRVKQYPLKLSGGEQQRISIARSLINNPSIIYADEPTGNVDEENEKNIITIFENIVKQGKSVIVITHNEIYEKYVDNVFYLRDGKLERGKY